LARSDPSSGRHARARKHGTAIFRQIPLTVLMIAYILFELWLLSACAS
jgi:hypothetical protein